MIKLLTNESFYIRTQFFSYSKLYKFDRTLLMWYKRFIK